MNSHISRFAKFLGVVFELELFEVEQVAAAALGVVNRDDVVPK